MMAGGGSEGGEADCQPELSPAAQAYKEWLVAHTYWSMRHDMMLAEYRELAKDMAIAFDVVKRWPE